MLVSTLKLSAAAGSMGQFHPVVRSIFPERPNDVVVEATTAYLYATVAREVFNPRFARMLIEQLRDQVKYAAGDEIATRAAGIERRVEMFEHAARQEDKQEETTPGFTQHVRCVLKAILFEADLAFTDPALLRTTFARFEDAARTIKKHLRGIKKQNAFVMKRS